MLAAHSEHFRNIFFKQNTDNVIALQGPQHLTPKNVLSKDGFDIFYAFISAGSRRIGAMIAGNFVNKVRGIVKSKNINAWGINNFISQKTKTKVQFFGENQKSVNLYYEC